MKTKLTANQMTLIGALIIISVTILIGTESLKIDGNHIQHIVIAIVGLIGGVYGIKSKGIGNGK